MKIRPAFLLAFFLPAPALAGAQYTAEDVIRYFEQANAAADAPAPSIARTAPAAARGVVVGEPPTGTRRGAVVGAAPGAVPAAAAVPGDAPLVIPMTGAQAGYTVPPAESAAPPRPEGYDMLVTFEIDSATLTPQARQNLDAFAQAMASPALSAMRFAVEGHTDATGSAEHNLRLSEARAVSVVGYLVGHGVDAARLSAAGFGETRPRLSDPEHPENRRVETRPID